MKTYRYTIDGTGGDGQTWTTTGTVSVVNAGVLMAEVMQDSFEQLTAGKAVYGKPGVGCRGPYDIRRVVIEQVLQ